MNEAQSAGKIVKWLRQQAKKAGANGVVFGLSGGIDSSVTAVLCKRAFPNACLALAMPCNSNESDLLHAKILAKMFGIPLKVVDLSKPFGCILDELGEGRCNERKNEIANIKPRLRMLCLYHFANKLNCLVVGTGNKSELMTGYFTKFGDGAADLLPIADLYKGEVKKLAAHLGIAKEIIEKQPSAGLWKGQTDEAQIGLPYEKLDRLLEKIEKGAANAEDKQAVKKIKEMMKQSEHKRKQAPICALH